ncbi:Non-structural maintenance of chromosomes element 4 like protein A [Habropoda laboriosa]|uniref:Non-structural maintenance of chromosomes element 4 n=1 Tax=Habropoda laboriosa TaxID=597456 RepID=A0A0L7RCP7_9HYME|nr:Non-structural maintenance of chromosomes element 4 like protein A [Habropoda laboriosa]
MSRNNSDSNERLSIVRSPQERKEILRKIINEAESLQDMITDNTIQSLEVCMEQTDTINSETTLEEKLHNQDEILMDSEMMSISSKVLKQCTRHLTNYVSSYNHVEFAQKLVKHLRQLSNVQSETPDWSVLERKAIKCFKRTPHYSTLSGTLAPLEKKEINKRKSVVRDVQAQIRKPENITTVDKEEDGPERTVKMKQFITRYCKTHRKPLDFFKLVLHPSDFGKTIENILQISFLVRDGRVKITKDASGILLVQPSTKDMMTQVTAGKIPNIQNVIYLNMEQWKMLKDTYRLEKPMIEYDV